MLLEVPQTLCDANYVNNDKIRTPGDGLLVRIYPAGTSRFLVYDGTDITCQADGGGVKVTIDSPKPRPVQLEILAPRPASGVRRDGTALAEKADPAEFAEGLGLAARPAGPDSSRSSSRTAAGRPPSLSEPRDRVGRLRQAEETTPRQ